MRDAGDICSPPIPAAVVQSAPATAPATPRAGTQRAPKRGIKAIAAPNSPIAPVPPVQVSTQCSLHALQPASNLAYICEWS